VVELGWAGEPEELDPSTGVDTVLANVAEAG